MPAWLLAAALPSALAAGWTFVPDPTAHVGEVEHVAVAPSGGLSASVGRDGTLRLWSSLTGEATVLPRPEGAVRELFYTGNGSRLVVGLGKGTTLLLDALTGDELGRHSRDVAVDHRAVSADGDRLALVRRDSVVVVDPAGTELFSWQRQSGDPGTHTALGKVTFDEARGRLLVAGVSRQTRSGKTTGVEGQVFSLPLDEGEDPPVTRPFPVHDLRSYDREADGPRDAGGSFEGKVDRLVLDEDFLLLAGRTVRLGVEGQASAAVLHTAPPRGGSVADLSLARGRVAGFDLPNASFWTLDLGTGAMKRGGPEHRLPSPWRADLDLDADLALVADQHGALLWFRPSDRVPVALAAATVAPVTAVTRSGSLFLLGDAEGRLTWLSPEGHERLRSVETGLEAIHDLDEWNGFVAVAGDRLQVYEVASGKAAFTQEARDLKAVAWAEDLLLSAHEDGRLRLWRGGRSPLASVQAHEGAIVDLVTSPDATSAATLGADGELRLWSLPAAEARWTHQVEGTAHGIAFTEDGAMLQVLRTPASGPDERVLIDVRTGEERSAEPVAGAAGFVGSALLRDLRSSLELVTASGVEDVPFTAGPAGPAARTETHLLVAVDEGLGFALYRR